MTRRVSKDEGGWILIVCVVMTTVLAMVGLLVVQGVWVNAKTFGAQRNAESARYIAEAGVSWAVQQLNENENYVNGTSLNYGALLGLQTINQLGDDTPCTAQLIRDFADARTGETCYPPEPYIPIPTLTGDGISYPSSRSTYPQTLSHRSRTPFQLDSGHL